MFVCVFFRCYLYFCYVKGLVSTGEMIVSSPKYNVQETSMSLYETRMTLTIRKFQKEDIGSYRCIAKNSLGEVDSSIRLYGKYMIFFIQLFNLVLLHGIRKKIVAPSCYSQIQTNTYRQLIFHRLEWIFFSSNFILSHRLSIGVWHRVYDGNPGWQKVNKSKTEW